MAVGIVVTKEDLNRQSGQIARSLGLVMEQIEQFQRYLAATPGEELEAPPIGFTPEDVSVLKSAFGDLDHLRQVYLGQATQAEPLDFRRFAGQLVGTGLV